MKIYFTAPTSFNGQLHNQYKVIFSLLEKYPDCKILSGAQIIDKQLLSKDKQISSEEIFKREQDLINQADVIIAEASKP